MKSIPADISLNGVMAVRFALSILSHLAKHTSPVGVSTLSRELNTNKNRIHRHLQTLVSLGFVVRDAKTLQYGVGAELLRLSKSVVDNFDLLEAARDSLVELKERFGHTVTVAKADRWGVRILTLLTGQLDLRAFVTPGAVLELHSNSQGKIVLAFGDPDLRSRILKSRLRRVTPFTIVDSAKLARELDEISERGWASNPNEAAVGFNGLSAPIFDATGQLSGVLAMIDSIESLKPDPSKRKIEALQKAARRVSNKMGASR